MGSAKDKKVGPSLGLAIRMTHSTFINYS